MHKNASNVINSSLLDVKSIIGEAIFSSRIKMHLTQRELSEKSGVSLLAVANIEKGDTGTSIKTLAKIATAMNSHFLITLINKNDSKKFTVNIENGEDIISLINSLIKSQNISKIKFAEAIGVDFSFFKKLQKGNHNLRVSFFEHIAYGFDMFIEISVISNENGEILNVFGDYCPLSIALKLKKLRKLTNLSQSKLAKKSGVSQIEISCIEAGKKWPLFTTLTLVAQGAGAIVRVTITPGDNNFKPICVDISSWDSVYLMGNVMKQLRKERALTQKQFSKITGMHPPILSMIENGKYLVTPSLLSKVSKNLNLRVDIDFIKNNM